MPMLCMYVLEMVLNLLFGEAILIRFACFELEMVVTFKLVGLLIKHSSRVNAPCEMPFNIFELVMLLCIISCFQLV